jgi:hypothetical protein
MSDNLSDFSDIDIEDEFGEDVVEDKVTSQQQQGEEPIEQNTELNNDDEFEDDYDFEDYHEESDVVKPIEVVETVNESAQEIVQAEESEQIIETSIVQVVEQQPTLDTSIITKSELSVIDQVITDNIPKMDLTGILTVSNTIETTKKKKRIKKSVVEEKVEIKKPWYYRSEKPYDTSKVQEFMKKRQVHVTEKEKSLRREKKQHKQEINDKLKVNLLLTIR